MSSQHGLSSTLPRHIAVVMDGNGRWARKRLLPRTAGHRSGVKATRRLVEDCINRGIECLTVFAFSSENWNRPQAEVSSLMSLFISTLASEIQDLNDKQVRVSFIGERTRFSAQLQQAIADAEQLTQNNRGLRFNIAVNYGGRWDIVNAARQVLAQGRDPAELSEADFAAELQLADQPDIDLFIRTGGESRISNFLIWQSAYAELYFCDVLWPDFDSDCLQDALNWYTSRERRFGKTSAQLAGDQQARN